MSTDKKKLKMIFNILWPLAISWMFMAVDNPSVSAIVSRMNNPEISLAAHGGVVYPISLMIEAPIMMMLSVSIALCKDRLNFNRIHRFMLILCTFLTVLHASICAITPLFYFVVRDMIGAPEALFPYIRIGLTLMIPWSGSIGYRRFYQGILIRSGHSKQVTVGTMVRMGTLLSVLFTGYFLRRYVIGSVVAAVALSAGVFAEGMFAGYKGRRAAKESLAEGSPDDVISWKELITFCIPLVLMQIINLGWISLGSSAMSRMINPIASLAIWPVMSGLVNILKSFGNACNETTMTVIPREKFYFPMRKATFYVGIFGTALWSLLVLTPFGDFWFMKLSALKPELAGMAGIALPFIFFVPMANAFLNFYQGILMSHKRSNELFEGLLVFLLVVVLVLGIGIAAQKWEGIYVTMIGLNAGMTAQALWLRFRAKKYIKGYATEVNAEAETSGL